MILTWETSPENTTTSYEYRMSDDGATTWSVWKSIPSTQTKGDDNKDINSITHSYTVTGLTNDREYIFEVRALNGQAKSETVRTTVTPRESVTAPEIPGDLTATAGNAQVILNWKIPSNGGKPIISYKYRVSHDDGNTWAPDWEAIPGSGANTRSYTVTGLTNNVTYTFEVRAINEVGEGDSARVTGTPILGVSIFSAPGNLTATTGDTQITLNWEAPSSNGGSAITHYRYRVQSSGSGTWTPDWTNVPGGASVLSYTVTGLTNGEDYIFEVQAVNGMGESLSTRVTGLPISNSAPSVVNSFVATTGIGRVALSWQAPSSNGDSAIAHYRYRVRKSSSSTWTSDWTEVPGGASTLSHTVTDLSNDVEYTFRVQAVNGTAGGPPASATATPSCASAVDGTLVGAGTSEDPYIVCSANHLDLVGSSETTYTLSSHYKMGQDIDLNNEDFTPIGVFEGEFDGDGKKIKNLQISSSAAADLALFMELGGVIKDLGIETFSVILSNESGASYKVGSLVAINKGLIDSCYAVDSDAQGDISVGSSSIIGGLVGSNEGTIISSYTKGTVAGGDTNDKIGGLVGSNEGAIISSYANVEINAGGGADSVGGLVGFSYISETPYIISSYATGAVNGENGNDHVGGLLGQSPSANDYVISSYATGDVNGGGGDEDSVGGLVGIQDVGSTIIASYATGSVNGGDGSSDKVGKLLGSIATIIFGTITSSYGFGTTSNGTTHIFETTLPTSVTSATGLTSNNAGASWAAAAWDFGTTSQNPALKYVDNYGDHDDDDQTEDTYTCSSTTAFIPPISITCGSTLIPEQR